MLAFVLAAALTTVPEMNQHLDLIDTALEEMETFLHSGLQKKTEASLSGLVILSPEEPGKDGLHPIIIVGVLKKSPAGRLGFKPGDRIIAINKRLLEHETTEIVQMLLDGGPKTYTLKIHRGPQELSIILTTEPLPCTKDAVGEIRPDYLMDRVASLKKKSQELRKEVFVSETLKQVADSIELLSLQVLVLDGEKQRRLMQATIKHCEVVFE